MEPRKAAVSIDPSGGLNGLWLAVTDAGADRSQESERPRGRNSEEDPSLTIASLPEGYKPPTEPTANGNNRAMTSLYCPDVTATAAMVMTAATKFSISNAHTARPVARTLHQVHGAIAARLSSRPRAKAMLRIPLRTPLGTIVETN